MGKLSLESLYAKADKMGSVISSVRKVRSHDHFLASFYSRLGGFICEGTGKTPKAAMEKAVSVFAEIKKEKGEST